MTARCGNFAVSFSERLPYITDDDEQRHMADLRNFYNSLLLFTSHSQVIRGERKKKRRRMRTL